MGRGEMVYNVLEDVLDKCPTYDTFLRWYCYPSLSDTVTSLARDLEMIKQMLPLQTHVDRQLFNARVQCVLERYFWSQRKTNAVKLQIEIAAHLVSDTWGSVIPPLTRNCNSNVEELKWL